MTSLSSVPFPSITSSLPNDAAGLALAITFGRAGLEDVAAMANAHMLRQEEPDWRLIELSLTPALGDALSRLNELSEGVSSRVRLARALPWVMARGVGTPDDAARLAFGIAQRLDDLEVETGEDPPPGYWAFYAHEDDIRLALDRTVPRTPAACVAAFEKDLERLAASLGAC